MGEQKEPRPKLSVGTRVRVRDLRTISGGRFSSDRGRVVYPPGDPRSGQPQSHVVELDGPFCHLVGGKGARPWRRWVCSDDLEVLDSQG